MLANGAVLALAARLAHHVGAAFTPRSFKSSSYTIIATTSRGRPAPDALFSSWAWLAWDAGAPRHAQSIEPALRTSFASARIVSRATGIHLPREARDATRDIKQFTEDNVVIRFKASQVSISAALLAATLEHPPIWIPVLVTRLVLHGKKARITLPHVFAPRHVTASV